MTKAEEKLYEMIFTNGKQMLSPEINSVDFHAMAHEDTEILGMFCDFSGIHGEELKKLLIRGYLKNISPKDEMVQDIKKLISCWFCALEDEGCGPWDDEECVNMARKYGYTKEDYQKYLSTIV